MNAVTLSQESEHNYGYTIMGNTTTAAESPSDAPSERTLEKAKTKTRIIETGKAKAPFKGNDRIRKSVRVCRQREGVLASTRPQCPDARMDGMRYI